MKRILTSIGSLLLLCQAGFAASGLFFDVTSSGNMIQIRTNITNTYSNAGIKINTPGYRISNPGVDCKPASNGYCLFSVNNATTKSIAITGSPGTISLTLCLNGSGPISCQNYSAVLSATPPTSMPMAYVTAGTTDVLICPINNGGTFDACTNANVTFQTPRGIALNGAGNRAYVVNNAPDTVSLCHVNVNGSFASCEDSGNSGVSFFGAEGIALNPAGTFAYVSNVSSHQVLVCPIDNTGHFGACVNATGEEEVFAQPVGIVLNQANTFAYVADSSANLVYLCPILNNGSFGTCQPTESDESFNGPTGIALNPENTRAYISNINNDRISVCPILSDGLFGTCQFTSDPGVFSSPIGIALNAVGNRAYVANGDSSVSECTIIPLNGTFTNCVSAGGGVSLPIFLALREQEG